MSKKSRKNLVITGGLILLLTFVPLTTCDIGLGEIVNTDVPVIKMPDGNNKEPGAFLVGDENKIVLDVQQPFGLSEVYMEVTYICNGMEDCEYCVFDRNGNLITACGKENSGKVDEEGKSIPKRIPAKYDEETDTWSVNLDTTGMADGTIRTQVTAVDRSGKRTTTTEIVYTVKNNPPQIELTIPELIAEAFDKEDVKVPTALFTGNSLMGIATDAYGIAAGYPKIMLWPAPTNREYFDDSGNPKPDASGHTIQLDSSGLPSSTDEKWGLWRTVLDAESKVLTRDMLKAIQFRYPLDEFTGQPSTDTDGRIVPGKMLPAGDYRFMIKVRDAYDNSSKENIYPDRNDKKITGLPNYAKYISITLVATDNPIIRFQPAHPEAHWTGSGNNCTQGLRCQLCMNSGSFVVYDPGEVTQAQEAAGIKAIAFPTLYNNQSDFGADIVAKMSIATGNPPLKVYAKINNSDDPGFVSIASLSNEDAENRLKADASLLVNVREVGGFYYIRINKDAIPQMICDHSPKCSLPDAVTRHLTGDRMLHVRAVDKNYNDSISSRQIIIDNLPPTLSIFDPAGTMTSTAPLEWISSNELTSTVTMRGSALDNHLLDKMYYTLGVDETTNAHLPLTWDNNSGWTDTGIGCSSEPHKHNNVDCNLTGPRQSHPSYPNIRSVWSGASLSSWTWTFHDIKDFIPPDGIFDDHLVRFYKNIDSNRTLYELPIKFKIIDKAQNVSIINASLILDPVADIPTIQINSHNPALDIQTVGGLVYLNGIAIDNEWIHDVEMRIITSDNSPDEGERANYSTFKSILNSSVNRGSTVSWSVDLNKNNKWKGEYTFEFRARDAYLSSQNTAKPVRNHPRETTTLKLIFDPNIPTITAEIIQDDVAHTATPGISRMVKGNINLKLTVTDDEKIESVKIKTSAETLWSKLVWSENYLISANRPAGVTVTPDPPPLQGSKQYIVTIPINTQSLKENEVFTIDIEAEDNTTPNKYRTQYSVALMPDNSKPVISFVDPQEWKPSDKPLEISGKPDLTSTVTIRGSVTDNQQVAKLYYVMGKTELDKNLNVIGNWNNTGLDTPSPLNSHPVFAGTGNVGKVTWEGTLSSWNVTIRDTADFFRENAIRDQFLTRVGTSNTWELPFKFRAVDTAGNAEEIERILIIDPDKDIPKIIINSHSNTPREDYPQTVGGKVNINGLAVDNERIHDVEIRISKETSPGVYEYNVPGYNNAFNSILASTTSRSSTVSWQYELNAHTPTAQNPRWEGKYKIEIRARDSYLFTESNNFVIKNPRTGDQAGKDIEEIIFVFDPGVPEIEASIVRAGQADTVVVAGISTQVRGTIIIKLIITDNQKIESIRTRDSLTNIWSNNYLAVLPAGTTILESAPNGSRYVLQKTINTESLAGQGLVTNGVYTIEVEATDNTSPVAYTHSISIALLPDNIHPVIQFTEPQNWAAGTPSSQEVSSTVTLRGTVTDNQKLKKLYYRMGKTDIAKGSDIVNWEDTLLDTSTPSASYPSYTGSGDVGRITWAGALSSWNVTIRDTADFLRDTTTRDRFVTQVGGLNEWELPFQFMAVDEAGNTTIVERKLVINPDADIPKITINSHNPAIIQIIGGKVNINGLAADNEWIKDVEMRITKDGVGVINGTVDYSNFVSILKPADSRSSTVSWAVELNAAGNWRGKYKIEIRARDSYLFDQHNSNMKPVRTGTQAGKDVQIIEFIFDPEIPEIKAWIQRTGQADTAVVAGVSTQVRGNITIKLDVTDAQGLVSIQTKTTSNPAWSGNYLTSTPSGGVTVTQITNGYTVLIPINTNTMTPNSVFTMDVEATDNTEPVGLSSQFSIMLMPDNTAPVVQFTEPQSWSLNDSPEVSSTVTIRGTVTDNQKVSKLYYRMGKIDVAKGDDIVNWEDTRLDGTPSSSYPGFTGAGDTGRITWAGTLSSWNVTIRDTADFLRDTATRDRFVEQVGSLNEYELKFQFLAIDEAGNQTKTDRTMFINPDADIPRITINSHKPEDVQIVGTKVNINGLAVDNEWIKDVQMRISKDNGSGTFLPDPSVGYQNWTSILAVNANRGSTVSWSHELNNTSNWLGKYKIEILARDSYLFDQNNSNMKPVRTGTQEGKDIQTIVFIFDDGYPVILADIVRTGLSDTAVTAGVSTQVRGSISLRLNITDTQGLISIRTKNNVNNVWSGNYLTSVPAGVTVTPIANGYTVLIPVNTTTLPENQVYTVDVEATDNTQPVALSSQFSIMLMPDNQGPTFNFVEPQEWNGTGTPAQTSAEVTSTTVIRGSIFDNQQLDKLEYALGHTEITNGTWTNAFPGGTPIVSHNQYPGTITWDGSLSSWSVRFKDTAEFFLTTAARDRFLTPVNGQINKWQLRVLLRAVDKAGNETLLERILIIDPNADLPTIDISSHPDFKQTIGGSVNLSGIATDNESVHSVQIRITMQTNAAVTANNSLFTTPDGTVINESYATRITGNAAGEYWLTLHPAGFNTSNCAASGCNGQHVILSAKGRTGGQGTTVSWMYNIFQEEIDFPGGNREFLVEVRPRDASVIALGTMKDVSRPATTQSSVPIARQRLNYTSGTPTISGIEIIKHTFTTNTSLDYQYDALKIQGKVEPYLAGISMISGAVTFRAIIEDDGDITSVKMSGLWNTADNIREFIDKVNVDGSPFISKLGRVGTKQQYALYIPVDTKTKPTAASDLYSFTISVEDNTSPISLPGQQMISVTVDNTPPSILFIEPLQSPSQIPNVTSTVIVKGTLTDNQKVASLEYALGKTAAADVTCTTSGLHNGTCGNTNCDGFGGLNVSTAWINTNLHTSNPLTTPAPVRTVWSRTLSSWEWRFENISDVSMPAVKDTYVTELLGSNSVGLGLYYLPISFKVTDVAGNFYVERITLLVDPNRDLPTVKVSSPSNEQAVGGATRMNGTAEDNEIIHRVQYRILMQSNAQCDTGTEPAVEYKGWDYVNIPSYGAAALTSAVLSTADLPNYTSMVSWYINLNDDAGLTPPEDKNIRRVKIELRAQDATIYTSNIYKSDGPVTSIYLNFDNSVPTIEEETIFYGLPSEITDTVLKTHSAHPSDALWADCKICEKFISGTTRIRGNVTMRLLIKDEKQIDSIRVRAGALNEELLYNPNYGTTLNDTNPWTVGLGPQITVNNEEGNFVRYAYSQYYVFIPMATNTASGSKFGSGKVNVGEIVNLTIQAMDDTTPAPYMAQGNYPLEIDNRYPLADYTGNYFAIGNQFEISGTAWDTGDAVQVQGVERVVVYLSKLDAGVQRIVNISGGSVNTTVNNPITTQSARTERVGDEKEVTVEGTSSALPFFPNVRQENGSFITTSQGLVLTDGFGLSGAAFKTWAAQFNTTVLSDGKYMLNYVVFDRAENATYYWTDIYIANNAPVINSISLGTDVDLSGTVTDGSSSTLNEYVTRTSVTNKEIATGFRVRNNMFNLRLGASTVAGKSLSYRVAYVNRTANPVTSLVKGQVYTISAVGSDIGRWSNFGVFGIPETGTTFVATRDLNPLPAVMGTVYGYNHQGGTAYSAISAPSGTIANTMQTGTTITNTIAFGTAAFGTAGDNNLIRESNNVDLDAQGNFIWRGDGKCTCIPVDNSTWHICAGNNQDLNKRFFLIHVYDNTVSSGTFTNADQLSAVALINVGINNIDGFAPRIEYAGFGSKHVIPSSASEKYNYVSRARTAFAADGSEYNRNIVTTTINESSGIGTGTKKGYVQYAAHSAGLDNRDNVSGMVIFKGKAMDNRQVQRITAQIQYYPNATPVAGTEFTIAVWNTTTRRLEAANTSGTASGSLDTIAAMRTSDSQAWGFSVDEGAIDMDFGHVLNWNFAWDTSTINATARDNITVTFRVYDAATGGLSANDATTVNIKPYITELITPLSSAFASNPSAFARSANGWYPVLDSDVIQIKGFNFTTDTTTTVRMGGTANAADGTSLALTATSFNGQTLPARSKFHINATMQAIDSNSLRVRVNGIDSINNSNNNAAGRVSGVVGTGYNDEPNSLNNNMLTDDRKIYVWSTGNLVSETVVMNNTYMRMRADNPGWHAVYNVYSGNKGLLRHATNNDDPVTREQDANRYLNTTVAVDQSGNWYAAASNMTSAATYYTFGLYLRGTVGGTGDRNSQSNTNKRRLLTMRNPNTELVDADRVEIPRVFAQRTTGGVTAGNSDPTAANPTRILMTYFDPNAGSTTVAGTNPIIFRYGLLTANTVSATAGFLGNIPTNGGTAAGTGTNATAAPGVNDTQVTGYHNYATPLTNTSANQATGSGSMTGGNEGRGAYGSFQVVARDGAAHAGSIYTAVGSLSNGVPVIAWYDRTNQNLVFSYLDAVPTATAIVSAETATWQLNARVIHKGAGTHVEMAIDGNDNIHLAYYDVFNGGLWYAYIPVTGATQTARRPNPGGTSVTGSRVDATNVRIARVDTYLSAGTKLQINIRDNIPYISYFHASFAETRNSIRVAWPKTAITSANDVRHGTYGRNTAQATFVQSAASNDNYPADSFTGDWEVMTIPTRNIPRSNEFVCNGVPASTTAVSSPSASLNANIRNSILVGYLIGTTYEGARLRDNIVTKTY